MVRFKNLVLFALALTAWGVCADALPDRKIILGIGQPVLDYYMKAHPSACDLGEEEHRCIDGQTYHRMAHLSFNDVQPGGIVFNTLSLLKQQLNSRIPGVYEVQQVGTVGRDGAPFLNHLTQRGIVWKGDMVDDLTGRCLIFSHNAKRSMAVLQGAARSVDLDQTRAVLNQDDIELCMLDGFLLSKDAPFDRAELVNSVCERLLRQKTLFLLPSKEFILHNTPSFFLNILGRFGQCSGNWSEYMAIFGMRSDDLLECLIHFAGNYNVTLRVTRGAEGSCTVTPAKIYIHEAITPSTIQGTTGAGDAYVAGFECERLLGSQVTACGATGALMAAHIIQGTLSF
jgi:sugar/nucleoside kinase (ribokinase family)